MLFLSNRPSKLGPGRTKTAPLHISGDATVMEILSQRRCDFEVHVRKSSSNRTPVKSLFPKLTHHEICGSDRITAIHVSLCQERSTSLLYALWRAHCCSGR